MELRRDSGAGRGRAPVLRALALVALYAVAAVVACAPAIAHFRSSFMADGHRAGYGEAVAGDHLQSVYRFWLVGHQLERKALPWRDPYSFQPLVEPQANLSGWPFGIPYWPLDKLFGPVVAWNMLLLATIVLAGLATYGWLRTLALPPPAAAIGGLAFAIAPYRLAQSGGHLLGWLAVLIPICLFAYERSRASSGSARAHLWGLLAAASLVSIPASGQVHLALGALPFCFAYALARAAPAPLAWMIGGTLAGIGAGLAIRGTIIGGSTAAGGRSLEQVEVFSAGWTDLVSRFRLQGLEEFVYTGWLVPVTAVVGLVLVGRRRPWLAVLFALGTVVPLLLSLGTNLPGYAELRDVFPPLKFPRVPERLVPVANVALAALVAYAVAWGLGRLRAEWRRAGALVAFVLVAADLLVFPFGANDAGRASAAYGQLAQASQGRILELPYFTPGTHYGSVYHYYALEAPRERPAGYSTLAPPDVYRYADAFRLLGCGAWQVGDREILRSLGVRFFLFHLGLYRQARLAGAWFAWQGLQGAGYRARPGSPIWLLEERPAAPPQRPPVPEPPHRAPVFCEGWSDGATTLSRAALWVYGEGRLGLTLARPEGASTALHIDGDAFVTDRTGAAADVEIDLTGERWHLVVLESPALVQGPAYRLRLTRIELPETQATSG